jgi:hypothetical protein
MTLAQMRELVLRYVDEDVTQPARWISNTDANNALTMALRIYCFLTLASEAKTSVTINASNFDHATILSSVPDMIIPLRITQDGVQISRSQYPRFRARSDSWRRMPDLPQRYAMISGNAIAIDPPPVSSNYTQFELTYAKFCPLPSDGNEPQVPAEDHDGIAAGAAAIVAGLKIGGQDQTMAQARLSEFFDCIARRIDWVQHRTRTNRYDVAPAPVAKALVQRLMASITEGAAQ